RYLLTFRSAAAGYFDLTGDGGTGNIGGFKSGCTSNLIAAGGVLNAPDYTRTCRCSYQNQTSLALVHDPSVQSWHFSAIGRPIQPIRRVGLNLGAPGDRAAAGGTLWLDTPSVGGASPDPVVRITPAPPDPESFLPEAPALSPASALKTVRRHPSRLSGDGPAWVTASALTGLRRLEVTLIPDPPTPDPDADPLPPPVKPLPAPKSYTVRLYFAELEERLPGERVFSVAVGGKVALKDFDPVKAAGGPLRGIVRELRGVKGAKVLTISLTPSPRAPKCKPILNGIEIVAEP
ncbi:hypothetical protein LCGC14_1275600, partial [marine sediment metagenome]